MTPEVTVINTDVEYEYKHKCEERHQVDLNKMVSEPKHIWDRGCRMSGVDV